MPITIDREGSGYLGRTSSPPWRRPYDPLDATGDWSWHWTPEAEAALDLNTLTASVEGRQN